MPPANNRIKRLGENLRANRVSYLMMLPYLIFFVLFTILPVIVSIVLSFTDYDMVQAPVFVGLENYFQIFLNDEYFIVSLKNTLIFAIILGPASYVICFLVAWLINDLKPLARALVTALFYIPTIVGAAGWGVWRLIFSSDQYGLINGFLMKLGFINEPIGWLTDEAYILPVLIVVSLWMSMGISFLTFIAGFQNVDKSLYEAGMMDGIKNRFQGLWYITIPSMAPQLMFGAVMQITQSFAVADISINLAGNPSVNYAGATIVTHLLDYGSTRLDMGYASAIATILFLLMVGTNKLVQKLLGRVGE